VNFNYNRKPALFAPITKKFDGEDLVSLRSRVLSLSVTDSESVTLRERWSEAVSQARHVIGFTELAVLAIPKLIDFLGSFPFAYSLYALGYLRGTVFYTVPYGHP